MTEKKKRDDRLLFQVACAITEANLAKKLGNLDLHTRLKQTARNLEAKWREKNGLPIPGN